MNTKRRRRGTCCVFPSPFRKSATVPLTAYMWIYQKGEIVDMNTMSTVQKRVPHKCYYSKTGRLHSVTQNAVGTVANKQVKTKILLKRFNVHIEHLKGSRSPDSFLTCVKEISSEKEGSCYGLDIKMSPKQLMC